MTLNCINIFIATGSFLYWCVTRPASQRFFKHSWIYLRILIISYLATFLVTNSLYVLMCRKAVNQSINQLTACAAAVTRWHLENGLLWNPSKSEALIKGSRHHVQFFDTTEGLRIAGSTVPFVNNLDFWELHAVDNHLSFDQQVSDVVRSCNYHIRSLRHIRPLIDRETAVNVACSIVASRLDYCNSVLYDCQWS